MYPQPGADSPFRAFVQQRAIAMRSGDRPIANLAEWNDRRESSRRRLIAAWGGFPDAPCELDPKVLGRFDRGAYHVERLTLTTRPGILMTANAYVPRGDGRRPAVLCVHGHWRLAKQEPVVQSRCIGLARLGFFVLMVDAFGAGERAVGKELGEYHGEMTAATLWPSGLALAGLQVYDNMRAVDYLRTRPEVDPDRIGVTGASGGGNQTMYAGAIDDRFRCVVPVCSVGTYQAYLSAACCMCEVTPGALAHTEESAVLGLVAPRALMVISATRDAFQFSVGEASKSIESARSVFRAFGVESSLRHTVIESGHDYHQPMREAMYGWMTLHLKGEGDGSPIAEPSITVEETETLRCYPGDSRPDAFITLPQFAAREGRSLLAQFPPPDHAEHWAADRARLRQGLVEVLGAFPEPDSAPLGDGPIPKRDDSADSDFALTTEEGITISVRLRPAAGTAGGTAIVLDLDQGRAAIDSGAASALSERGWRVVTADLRATGELAVNGDRIGRAPDHNSAEWSLWIGRPLLGQWIWDVARLITALERHSKELTRSLALIGIGPASTLALAVAALDGRVHRLATLGGLATWISDVPFVNQRLGTLVPGILRRTGDIGQLAALACPRPLVVAGGVLGSGDAVARGNLDEAFAYTRAAYRAERADASFRLLDTSDPIAAIDAMVGAAPP
ncbi:MAG: acetylxylan esterase [Planctomycetes bacterium]|nr:acetylxylan esterase [Planctomycetota bacterium]